MGKNEQLIENIKFLMRNRKYSFKELADEIGCSPNTISNWVRFRTEPKKRYVIKMSMIFGCTYESMYSDSIVWKQLERSKPVYRTNAARNTNLNVNDIINIIEGTNNLSIYDLKYIAKATRRKILTMTGRRRKQNEKEWS